MSTTPIDRTTCNGPRHGDANAYRRGCRCPDAREGRRLFVKRWREGRLPAGFVPSIGATRRLRALAAIGWSPTDLAVHLDTDRFNVLQLRYGRCPTMTRTVHARIARVYDQLSGTPGGSVRVRNHAERSCWAPPLLWDGGDIDDPQSEPEQDKPEPARRSVHVLVEDFDDLVSKGLSEAQAAKQLGILPESIGQARKRVRESEARKAQITRKQDVA